MCKKYSLLLMALLIVAGCQSAPKPERQVAQHQRDHGASAAHRQAFIKDYDRNGDGVVTREEFDQTREAHLRAMDTNQDQRVDETEYVQEFVARMTDEQKEHKTKQLKQAHVRFGVLDRDKDGDLTVQEFALSGARIFAGWDLNQDGVVDAKDPLPTP